MKSDVSIYRRLAWTGLFVGLVGLLVCGHSAFEVVSWQFTHRDLTLNDVGAPGHSELLVGVVVALVGTLVYGIGLKLLKSRETGISR